jgi:ABC-type nitrate/sulfonate/bicarbonate transport system ATPase subunit
MGDPHVNNFRHLLRLACIAPFLLVLISFSAYSQKTGEKRDKRYVVLAKDARTNGYKITEENNEIFLDAVDVADPKTKKLIEGVRRLLYRCSQNGPEIPVPVTFSNGRVNRVKIGCTILYEPKILLADAPYPGQ